MPSPLYSRGGHIYFSMNFRIQTTSNLHSGVPFSYDLKR